MLIDSDFHDYYDTVLSHGIDKTCPYLRKTSEVTFEVKHAWEKKSTKLDELYGKIGKFTVYKAGRRDWYQRAFVEMCVVAFAGNFYPMVKVPYPDYTKPKTITYDLDEAIRLLKERFPKYMALLHRETKGRKKEIRWLDDAHPDKLADFFDRGQWGVLENLFREHNAPVLLLTGNWGRDRKIIINPVLKDIKFMKAVDTYTAFQEIHMFLSGVLGVGEPMTAEVGNDDRIKQRGFDKCSFRKPPGKKKRGRK